MAPPSHEHEWNGLGFQPVEDGTGLGLAIYVVQECACGRARTVAAPLEGAPPTEAPPLPGSPTSEAPPAEGTPPQGATPEQAPPIRVRPTDVVPP